MKYFIIISFLLLSSCGYPDIDSVPNFENLKISKEELTDLCKLTHTDKKKLANCISKTEERN